MFQTKETTPQNKDKSVTYDIRLLADFCCSGEAYTSHKDKRHGQNLHVFYMNPYIYCIISLHIWIVSL